MDELSEVEIDMARNIALEIVKTLGSKSESIGLYAVVYLTTTMIRELASNRNDAMGMLNRVGELAEAQLHSMFPEGRPS